VNKKRWKCDKCGRSFKVPNQWHSCVKIDINSHFKNKKQIRVIYDHLEKAIKKFGPLHVDPVKNSISIGNRTNFITVFIRKDNLRLDFLTLEEIPDNRFEKTSRYGERYYYRLKLSKTSDIDEKLLVWLKTAYNYNGKK
jgi:hypothetical protein